MCFSVIISYKQSLFRKQTTHTVTKEFTRVLIWTLQFQFQIVKFKYLQLDQITFVYEEENVRKFFCSSST